MENISAFLLIDYSSRFLRFKDSVSVGIDPIYSSLNIENRVFLKVGYDLNNLVEIYIKSGYVNDNIFQQNFSYSGWNFLTGIEISN